MTYPKIASLVPANEHFDESGIVNEGGFLTVAHFAAIERSLANSEAAAITTAETIAARDAELSTANANLSEANANVDSLNTTVNTLTEKNTNLQSKIDTHATRITELENQVAAFGSESSGTGSTLITRADETAEQSSVPGYLSNDDPGNAWLDKKMKRHKK